MKRNYQLICTWLITVLCSILFFSCKKDNNPDTKELLVYANNSQGTYNEFSMGFILVGDNVFGNPDTKISATVTRESPVNIEAKFVLDTTLVSAYNINNKTAYTAIPTNAFTLTNNGQFTIRKGAVTSDSLLLTITNPKLLTNIGGYLIPLSIKSTNGKDNLISSNRNTFFVKVAAVTATFQLKTSSDATPGSAGLDLTLTPAGVSFANKTIIFAAYANVDMPADITLTTELRPELIADFNSKNNSTFLSPPDGSYTILNGTATISAGSKTSNNFQIDFDASKFPNDATKSYLLPVGLKGADNGSGNVMYISINPYVQNVNPANSGLTGTAINRTGWSVTTTTAYLPANNMLDGDPTTAWDSDRGDETIVLDMGAPQSGIKGILISPNYVYIGDNISHMIVYSSTDGTIWKKQGDWTASHYPPGGSADAPEIENVQFYNPVNARYLKFTTSGTYYVGIGELNVVK